MLIRVRYTDNRFDMVRPEFLDDLLDRGVLQSFLRRDGWVTAASGPLRRERRPRYAGPERRTVHGHEGRGGVTGGYPPA